MIARISYSLAMCCVLSGACLAEQPFDLVGHWKLAGDCRDCSGRDNHGVNHGVDLTTADGARFDGIGGFIEVPITDALNLGKQDFSIAVWVHTEADLSDVLGDILSQYDPATRTGFTFGLLNSAGVTSSQSNYRNLSFGIDAGRVDQAWTDRGRPGNARFVMAMAVYDGQLYVGTYEEGENEAGHVYRYEDAPRGSTAAVLTRPMPSAPWRSTKAGSTPAAPATTPRGRSWSSRPTGSPAAGCIVSRADNDGPTAAGWARRTR